MVKIVTRNKLLDLIKTNKIVIVEFWAEWSEPAQKLDKLLDEILFPFIENDDSIRLVKIDYEHNKEFMEGLKIGKIPCIMLFHEGQLLELSLRSGNSPQNKEESLNSSLPQINRSLDRIEGFNLNIPNQLIELIKILNKIP